MPPKVKISKEDILNEAFSIVRESGAEALNARALANRLSCSTQPVFSNYPSMAALKEDVLERAYSLYDSYVAIETEKGEYPAYKASGMAYIRFAMEEKQLFHLLFMRNRSGERVEDDERGKELFESASRKTGIAENEASLFHLEMWICVHGIAVMIATGFQNIDISLASEILTDNYKGLRRRFEEKQNEK